MRLSSKIATFCVLLLVFTLMLIYSIKLNQNLQSTPEINFSDSNLITARSFTYPSFTSFKLKIRSDFSFNTEVSYYTFDAGSNAKTVISNFSIKNVLTDTAAYDFSLLLNKSGSIDLSIFQTNESELVKPWMRIHIILLTQNDIYKNGLIIYIPIFIYLSLFSVLTILRKLGIVDLIKITHLKIKSFCDKKFSYSHFYQITVYNFNNAPAFHYQITIFFILLLGTKLYNFPNTVNQPYIFNQELFILLFNQYFMIVFFLVPSLYIFHLFRMSFKDIAYTLTYPVNREKLFLSQLLITFLLIVPFILFWLSFFVLLRFEVILQISVDWNDHVNLFFYIVSLSILMSSATLFLLLKIKDYTYTMSSLFLLLTISHNQREYLHFYSSSTIESILFKNSSINFYVMGLVSLYTLVLQIISYMTFKKLEVK